MGLMPEKSAPEKTKSAPRKKAKPATRPAARRSAARKSTARSAATRPSAAAGAVVDGKRTGAAAFCWSRFDTMLGAAAARCDAEGRRTYVEGGAEVAVLALVGEELVLDFLPPPPSPELTKVAAHYTPTPGRTGWLQYRRDATRDPRSDLAAKIGTLLGRARAGRKPPPPAFRSIASAGGPYVCVPASRVAAWAGDVDAGEFPAGHALYRLVAKAPDTGALVALPAARTRSRSARPTRSTGSRTTAAACSRASSRSTPTTTPRSKPCCARCRRPAGSASARRSP
jgi:hypothetical protein